MRSIFAKPLIGYIVGIFLLMSVIGTILSLLTDEYIILFALLIIEFIILTLIMLHVFEKYMKPVKKATKTIDELVKGNFRARIHHASNGSVGELSNKINQLARNLSELSIHERIQANQLKTVIDNTQSGLVLIDEKGYIHLVNRKFTSIFGKKQRDCVGYLYYDVLENETIHQTVQETFLYEKNVKKSFTQASGMEKRYLEIVGAPIFNERNMLKGAVLVLYDITELKKLELMRKDFVANVSHELKTPITSIKGFSETLLDGAIHDQESRKKFLTIIFEETTRLQYLIEDLLTLSRLEKDEFEPNFAEVDMAKLLDEIIPIITRQAKQKQIRFTIELEEDISLRANRDQMKQLFINLLTNAVSYTQEKGNVTLTVESMENQVYIKVADTGIGIERKKIPRLFERFYRIDKARSRDTGGTGLGLAIVKHIVEVHNGEITVESEVNKGTVFHVYLPK